MRLTTIFVLMLPSPTWAIGLCEGLTDTSEVIGVSRTMRQIAVRRAQERCEETPDGEEARSTLEWVEVRDLRGDVKGRYGHQKMTADESKTLRRALPDVQPTEALSGVLKAGHFGLEGAGLDNRRCRIAISVRTGMLSATVLRLPGKKVLATVQLARDVEDLESATVKAWWMRTGAVIVFDVQATTVIDQGPLGTDSGTASAVVVARNDALVACAHPIQRSPEAKPPPKKAKRP